MNERIKELAEQAGIHPSNFEPDADIKVHMEKFAELIVRECSTLAFDGPNGILEHFGLGRNEE